ncbi:MAG: hypothetical protein J2P48_06920 [Alphaproteobacteria bacterium]|nr:hypothetical protein [Alphaproteobacteria bacterium]
MHALLRQAAFDNHMTMQGVLRAGLAMWLFANGYDLAGTDLAPPGRQKPQAGKQAS